MPRGGLNANNVAQFIEVGMTVGEFSSLLLKGPVGKLQPGAGQIKAAVENLRAIMREAKRRIPRPARIESLIGESATPTSPSLVPRALKLPRFGGQ